VSLTADAGREVAPYRIEAGESCMLTTSALLSGEAMFAEAVAQTNVRRVSSRRQSSSDCSANPLNFGASSYATRPSGLRTSSS
jgi:CRP/FNR family transcriptional regulator, anaerobic regulatory protein